MNNPDQIYTSFIKSTPEKVWEAITNPEFTRQYWGGNANVSEWKKGARWTHEGTAVHHDGTVLECVPPKLLVLSWANPGDTADVSRVTFEIEAVQDVVRLTVTHGGFTADSAMAGRVSKGWPLVLSSMKSFLETGEAIDFMAVMKPCNSAAA